MQLLPPGNDSVKGRGGGEGAQKTVLLLLHQRKSLGNETFDPGRLCCERRAAGFALGPVGIGPEMVDCVERAGLAEPVAGKGQVPRYQRQPFVSQQRKVIAGRAGFQAVASPLMDHVGLPWCAN